MKPVFQLMRMAVVGVFALVASQQQSCAAVTLRVVIDMHNVASNKPDSTQGKVEPGSQSQYNVTLGDDFISVKSDKGEEIFDFKSRRRYSVNLNDKTYVGYSLYDIVGFRSMEVANREQLGQMLTSAKVKAGALPSKAANEQEFSISNKRRALRFRVF